MSRSLDQPRNTDPKTVLVGMVASLQNAILPAIAISFAGGGIGLMMALPAFAAIALIGSLFSYIGWKRLTYTVGEQDIRVESGVLSRSARSVPYERIQDVSLEQKLLPRLFGLVSVKFETGSGGGEDLALQYLTEEAGEELRQLVRERRDDETAPIAGAGGEAPAVRPAEEAEPLFAMGPGRLFTFGLFEFSLAVFAVLGGLLQYADSFLDIEIWDPDIWMGWVDDYGVDFATLDANMQLIGAVTGVIGLLIVGSLTGMVRVFAREWGFLLERTARGFRRRRGLFTRTDVVMPIHRVQGVRLSTGWLRYRFGWHGLSFVSLAQDSGASSHVVAPFAKLREIAPIVEAAGFRLPTEDEDWRRASVTSLVVGAVIDGAIMLAIAAAVWVATSTFAPEWSRIATAIPLTIAVVVFLHQLLSWRFRRHSLDAGQIMARSGALSPSTRIATRLKLHSVEIAQGPFGRMFGYATLHLGQAGGTFSIPGVPIERAREVRRKVVETIAATDFSQLETA
ncbi:MAG: PH domain-containing protein [Erythrobacter sp.]